MNTSKEITRRLLAVLVMDLGYEKAPVHGRDALRHQFAWDCVEDCFSGDEIESEVSRMVDQQNRESEKVMANLVVTIRWAKYALKEAEEKRCTCSGTALQYEGGCCCERAKPILEAERKLAELIDKI